MFGILRLAGKLRKDQVSLVSAILLQATELQGSDWVHHGEESYPDSAWLQLEVSYLAAILTFIIVFRTRRSCCGGRTASTRPSRRSGGGTRWWPGARPTGHTQP